jgi:hypothetical protein
MALVSGFDIVPEVLDALGLKGVTGIREVHLHIVPDEVVRLEVIRYPSHDQIMDMTKAITDTYVLISKEKIPIRFGSDMIGVPPTFPLDRIDNHQDPSEWHGDKSPIG